MLVWVKACLTLSSEKRAGQCGLETWPSSPTSRIYLSRILEGL